MNFYSIEISGTGSMYINVLHRHFAMQFDRDSCFNSVFYRHLVKFTLLLLFSVAILLKLSN